MGKPPLDSSVELLPGLTRVNPLEEKASSREKTERPRVGGKFLYVNGRRFWVKGVTYGTFRPNEEGEPFPTLSQVRDDFQMMRETGVNTVRLYTPPPLWLAD